jgi:hypothetical protein
MLAVKLLNAIFCGENGGPVFDRDIVILDNSNTNRDSYSNLGECYDFTSFKPKSKAAQSFLAGSLHFTTSEIEVFQLI